MSHSDTPMLPFKRFLSTLHQGAKELAIYVALVSLWAQLASVPPTNISVTNLIVLPPPPSTAVAPERPEAPRLYRL